MKIVFDEQVAVITGGASGIGAETAKILAESGAQVYVLDVQDKKLITSGASVEYIHCNVANASEVNDVINTTYSVAQRIDILFANAGGSLCGNH